MGSKGKPLPPGAEEKILEYAKYIHTFNKIAVLCGVAPNTVRRVLFSNNVRIAEKGTDVCDQDCFNCIFPDCIVPTHLCKSLKPQDKKLMEDLGLNED